MLLACLQRLLKNERVPHGWMAVTRYEEIEADFKKYYEEVGRPGWSLCSRRLLAQNPGSKRCFSTDVYSAQMCCALLAVRPQCAHLLACRAAPRCVPLFS